MLDGFVLNSRLSRPALPRHPENGHSWYQREQNNGYRLLAGGYGH
jgi:hypothetical protein